MSLDKENKPNEPRQRKFDKSKVYEQLKGIDNKDVSDNTSGSKLKCIAYHASGLGVGLVSGYFLAKKLNKNKTLFAVVGAVLGVSLGHLAAKYFVNKDSESNDVDFKNLSSSKSSIKESLTSTIMNNPLFINNKDINKLWSKVLSSITEDESVVLDDFLSKIKPYWEDYSNMTPREKKQFAISELKMTEPDFIRANSIMEKMIATMLTGVYANK